MKLRISLVGSDAIVEADCFIREGNYFNFYRTTDKVFSIKAEEVKSVKEVKEEK